MKSVSSPKRPGCLCNPTFLLTQ